MKVYFGTAGLHHTWQSEFPENTDCVHCDGTSRIAFVAHEGQGGEMYVCQLHKNEPKGEGFWLHDAGAFATYLCKKCLKPTTLYNQA